MQGVVVVICGRPAYGAAFSFRGTYIKASVEYRDGPQPERPGRSDGGTTPAG